MQCVSLKDKAWSGPKVGVRHLLMAVLNDPLFSIEFLFPMEQTFMPSGLVSHASSGSLFHHFPTRL